MLLTTNFGQVFIISMLAVLLMAVLFGVIFFINSLKNIKLTQQNIDDIASRLSVGQKVTFSNGLMGEVISIHSETVDLQIKSGSVIEVYKESINEILK